MGLLSSIFGGNKSTTQQTQQTTSTSTQLSTGDIENGNVVTGSGNTFISYIPDVVSDLAKGAFVSFESARDLAGQAIDLVDGAMVYTGQAYTKALESVNKAQDNSYTFAGGVVGKSIDAIVNSVDGQRQANSEVLQYGAGITKLAFDANANNVDNTLGFAAGAFKEATSIQNKTLELNAQFATETFNQIKQSNNAALNAVESARNDAMSYTAGAYTKALDASLNQNKSYTEALTAFADKTIQTAVQSTKTESAQATDKIIDLTQNTTKYIILGVAGIAGLFLLRGAK